MKFIDSKYYKDCIKVCELKFGTLYFLDNIIISEMNGGIIVNPKDLTKVVEAIQKIYCDNRKFSFICNRTNSFTNNPSSYSILSNYNLNLHKVIQVCYTDIAKKVAMFERHFIPVQVTSSKDLEEAIYKEVKLYNGQHRFLA